MPKRTAAFDVKLTEPERLDLANELCREIQDALSARDSVIADGGKIDYLDWFYEQGQSAAADLPFPGAADLTSYFIYENVSAMRARIVDTATGVEPFCVVDGWGVDAKKAPLVEAFHDWQIHEEGLPEELAKVAHGALIEDAFVLEVRERIETRKVVEEIDVALEVSESGGAVFDESGNPKLQMDGDEPVPAKPAEPGMPPQPSAKVKRTYTKTRRLGPEYDVISMKDFVFLPGHAKHKRHVWGYAYRCWARIPELLEKVEDDIYDETAVQALGEQTDRRESALPPTVDDAAPSTTKDSAEKELFSLAFKRDLDGDGREEWYLATLSIQYRQLLRLKLDTFVMKVGKPRCVPFVLFPRRESVYGYSYAESLVTLAEEHTAMRNMIADRSALATNAPMTVLATALWDPNTQPIGVGRAITVRDHNEVKPMVIPDVPSSAIQREQALILAKERVGKLSDMSIGVQSQQARTLGENQMVQSGSAVSVKEPLAHFRTAIAHVMELRHAIWVDALEQDPKGLEAPADVVEKLNLRGVADFDGRFTAEMLKGKFRFKPYGSVDTADAGQRIQFFTQGVIALTNLAKTSPAIGQMMQNPEVAKTLMEWWAQSYKVRNAGTFMKALMQPPPMPMPAAGGMDAGGGMPDSTGAPPAGGPDIASILSSLGGGGVH